MGPWEDGEEVDLAGAASRSDATEHTTRENWWREWDLNPRYPLRYTRFRDERFQPLSHLSIKISGRKYKDFCTKSNERLYSVDGFPINSIYSHA